MNIDSSVVAIDTNVVVDSVQKSPEKVDDRQDVGSDVETSLGQHGKKRDVTATLVDDESDFETATKKEVHSGDSVVNPHTGEAKETEPEPNAESVSREEGQSSEKEKDVINVDTIDIDDECNALFLLKR